MYSDITCMAIEPSESDVVHFGLEVVAEGAANVVYAIKDLEPFEVASYDGTMDPSLIGFMVLAEHYTPDKFSRRLLRVRKEDQLPATIVDELTGLIEPEYLVTMTPIRVTPKLVRLLNNHLVDHNSRAEHRVGSLLDETQDQAMLVEDMRPSSTRPGFVVEFKPKWLAQSPDAPPDACRCRNCALRACRLAKAHDVISTKAAPFCPLGILHGDADLIRDAFTSMIARHSDVDDSPAQRTKIVKHLVQHFLTGEPGNMLLCSLRRAQRKFSVPMLALPTQDSANGEYTETSAHRNLAIAMTLRDCSLFVCYQYNGDEPPTIQAKLADLDQKPVSNVAKWQANERKLADGKWYQATDVDSLDMKCYLGKQDLSGNT